MNASPKKWPTDISVFLPDQMTGKSEYWGYGQHLYAKAGTWPAWQNATFPNVATNPNHPYSLPNAYFYVRISKQNTAYGLLAMLEQGNDPKGGHGQKEGKI